MAFIYSDFELGTGENLTLTDNEIAEYLEREEMKALRQQSQLLYIEMMEKLGISDDRKKWRLFYKDSLLECINPDLQQVHNRHNK